jgi:transcriptional regulator with XRE-family HTH domain
VGLGVPLGNRQIDLHIGLRLRQRRMALGITQADLAKAVGLTFQQIQKYESGANQLASSRLYEVALALRVPVSFFFEGLARSERSGGTNFAGLSLLATAEAQRLILSYWKIDKIRVRKHVRDLIQSLSDGR